MLLQTAMNDKESLSGKMIVDIHAIFCSVFGCMLVSSVFSQLCILQYGTYILQYLAPCVHGMPLVD
jgi:hypothetical protein